MYKINTFTIKCGICDSTIVTLPAIPDKIALDFCKNCITHSKAEYIIIYEKTNENIES